MTKKQQNLLVLFAQNYSIVQIAKKLKTTRQNISKRLNMLSEKYPKEFENTLSLRRVYKRAKYGIKYCKRFSELSVSLNNGKWNDYEI